MTNRIYGTLDLRDVVNLSTYHKKTKPESFGSGFEVF